jgi:hypothetical protein
MKKLLLSSVFGLSIFFAAVADIHSEEYWYGILQEV